MEKHSISSDREAGAALLILVAILAIIAALSIGTRYYGGSSTKKLDQQQSSQVSLDRIKNSIAIFAAANDRLPCPADGSSSAGTEVYTGSGSGITCTYSMNDKSTLPWKTLGLSSSEGVDPWGRKIFYQPSENLVGTGMIIGLGTAGTLKIYNTSGGTAIESTAAFVLISFGRNGAGGYSSAGIKITDPVAGMTDEIENTNDDDSFVMKNPIYSSSGYFDDFVDYDTTN